MTMGDIHVTSHLKSLSLKFEVDGRCCFYGHCQNSDCSTCSFVGTNELGSDTVCACVQNSSKSSI